MLEPVFADLDQWVEAYNADVLRDGGQHIRHFEIKVLGQTALAEMKVELDLFETQDLDAYVTCGETVKKKLDALLRKVNKRFDFLSHEIWMPKETQYTLVFESRHFTVCIAQPEYVLISKAIKSPGKNRPLLLEYLSKNPSKRFFDLAQQYAFDVEKFLE